MGVGIIRTISLLINIFLISESKSLKKWFGDGPNCPTLTDLCERLDMVFVKRTKLGLIPCLTGYKYQCMVRGEEVASPVETIENPDGRTLQVVAMNLNQTYLRKQGQWGPELKYRGHMEKTCRVPNWMYDHYRAADVIVISGFFFPGCTNKISMDKIFAYRGWKFEALHPSPSMLKEKFGLMIFSKYIMTEMDSKFFSCIRGQDLYRYGFKFVRIHKNDMSINIFAAKFKITSSMDLMLEQVSELASFITGRIMDMTYPYIIYSNIKLGAIMGTNTTTWIRNSTESENTSYIEDFKPPLRVNRTLRWGRAVPKFLYCPKIQGIEELNLFKLDCGDSNVFTEKLTKIPVSSTTFYFEDEKTVAELIETKTEKST